MSGTKAGGLKAVQTTTSRYGEDFYKKIGAKGGRNGKRGGFAATAVGSDGLTGPERASKFGAVGGRISRRKKKSLDSVELNYEELPDKTPEGVGR